MLKGIVRVVVKKARDLSPKVNAMKFWKKLISKNSCDSYFEVEVGSAKLRSEVVNNNLNPEWNFICEIPIEHTGPQEVKVRFFDHRVGSEDDLLGSCLETLEFLKENYKLASSPGWRGLSGSTAQGLNTTICHINKICP